MEELEQEETTRNEEPEFEAAPEDEVPFEIPRD